jgi:hypothetical protein
MWRIDGCKSSYPTQKEGGREEREIRETNNPTKKKV